MHMYAGSVVIVKRDSLIFKFMNGPQYNNTPWLASYVAHSQAQSKRVPRPVLHASIRIVDLFLK